MTANVQELTDQILSDKELVAKLENAGNAQEVSDLLKEKGIEISAAQIEEVVARERGSGELSEAELENVAGGEFKWRYLNPFYWLGRLITYAITKDMC